MPFKVPRVYLFHHQGEPDAKIIQNSEQFAKFAENQKDGMKKHSDYRISKRIIEVEDLSFLSDRNHRYGWIRRHYRHHRLRRALKKAEKIIASDSDVATDIVRYYFVPKDRIIIK
jgi:hypothetical protein